MTTPETNFDAVLQALGQARGPLQEPAAADVFCGDGHLPLAALTVEVQNHGALAKPLDQEQAQALHAISTPAPFGQREQTLLDTSVRDTGEIAAEQLTLQWQPGAGEALQAEVARALGLPAVGVAPHNLLVYGPGQFFKPHQDTETHDTMVGTLVLVWPSPHIGGRLQVRHGREGRHFDSQHLHAGDLHWIAFYADCQHEIMPVSEGWRVALTFDLMLPQDDAQTQPGTVTPALVAALREHFWGGSQVDDEPWVFLLEHEYSEHGLRWPLIKGEDRPRVAALRAAAHELGLVPRLALAEIQESWTSLHDGYYDDESPEPDELIDNAMRLDFWVDDDGHVMRGQSLSVSAAAAVGFSDTGEAFLVDEQYEGYMGNYGDTIDYWYRRATLVLQTAQGAQASRFVIDFDAALADALALARSGDAQTLAARLHAASDTLTRPCRGKDGEQLWRAYAELVAALPDAEQAHNLCRHFDWTRFGALDVAPLALLQCQHGSQWTQALLQTWSRSDGRYSWYRNGNHPWPQPLRAFVQACRDQDLPSDTLHTVLTCCLQTLIARDAIQIQRPPAKRHADQPRRMELVCELAKALLILDVPADSLSALVQHIRQESVLYPLLQLRPLLQILPSADALADVQALHVEVVHALDEALQKPQPAADDHSLPGIAWTCRCEDCQQAIVWAESPTGTPLTLAMAQARRDHVQGQMQQADAPLTTETVKKGRPYKLVLRKPADLRERRLRQRRQWQDDLAALQQ